MIAKEHLGDDASVDELDLSVRVERACAIHGIKTIGQLRARLGDLRAIGLPQKLSARAIEKALAEWGRRPGERLVFVDRARAAMLLLTEEERAALVSTFGFVDTRAMAHDDTKEHLELVMREAGGSPSRAREILAKEGIHYSERGLRKRLRAVGIAPAKAGRKTFLSRRGE